MRSLLIVFLVASIAIISGTEAKKIKHKKFSV